MHNLESVISAQPDWGFKLQRTQSVAAFRDHHSLHSKLFSGVSDHLRYCARPLHVSHEHGKICYIPSLARHGPVLAGEVKNHGSLRDVHGIELGFSRIHHIEHIRSFLIDGNGCTWKFLLQLLFHPLQGVDPLFLGNGHLIAGLEMGGYCFEQMLGHFTLRVAQTASCRNNAGHIDAKRTVHGAAAAHGTLAIYCFVEFIQGGLVYFVFLFDSL